MLDRIFRTDDPAMEDPSLADLVYSKDDSCGTLYLTVDGIDMKAIQFLQCVSVKVLLGTTGSSVKFKQGFSEALAGVADNDTTVLARDNVTEEDISEDHNDKAASDYVGAKNDSFQDEELMSALGGEVGRFTTRSKLKVSLFKKGRNARERQRVQPRKMSVRLRKQAALKISPLLNLQKTLNVKQEKIVEKKKSTALARLKKETQRYSMKYGKQSSSGVNQSECVDKLSHSETCNTEAKEVSYKKISPHLREESSHQDTMDLSPDMSLVPQVQSSPKACQYCSQVFESKRLFREHTKTLRTGEYKCELCLNLFSYKAHFQVHVRLYHSGQPFEKVSTSCGECGWEVKKRSSLKKHMMLHTGEYYYKCCVCTRQFLEPGTLNHHMKTHSSGGMIRCSCCNQRFATRSALSRHRMVSVEIKCYLCGQVFPNKTSRTQHYKIAHQTDILRCSMCTCMFSSPDELTFHLKKHNANRKKLCKICGKFFSRLEKHVVVHKTKTDVDDVELFVCDKCPKKFTNRSSFQRHLFVHSSEKLYQCPHCPKRFTDCGVLRKHLHLHQSVMQYKCEVCNKKCPDSYRLKVHMRVHLSSKEFSCRHCLQAFNSENALKSHMKKECLSQKATFSLKQKEAGRQHAGVTPGVLADLETANQPEIDDHLGFIPVYDVSYWKEVPPPTLNVSADGEAQSPCEQGCFKYLYQSNNLDSGQTLAATPAGSTVGLMTRAPFTLEHIHLNSLVLNREIKSSYGDSHVVGPPPENKDSGYLKC